MIELGSSGSNLGSKNFPNDLFKESALNAVEGFRLEQADDMFSVYSIIASF